MLDKDSDKQPSVECRKCGRDVTGKELAASFRAKDWRKPIGGCCRNV